jgi:hypothetical protein
VKQPPADSLDEEMKAELAHILLQPVPEVPLQNEPPIV